MYTYHYKIVIAGRTLVEWSQDGQDPPTHFNMQGVEVKQFRVGRDRTGEAVFLNITKSGPVKNKGPAKTVYNPAADPPGDPGPEPEKEE